MQLEERRNHSRLPVVEVQHIRHEADARQHLENGLAEIGKALALGGIEVAIDVIPAEVIFIIDEIIGHARVHKPFHTAVLAAPAEAHDEIAHMLALRPVFLLDGLVKRQHDARVRAIPAKLRRQRARHVRKAAGLYERKAFARRKKHL